MSLHRLSVWPPVAPLRRVVVAGHSMAPHLLPGDRLLVSPLPPIRPGDVVALRDPRDLTRILVKRVTSITPAGITVHGDHPTASTDSRTFGTVQVNLLLGRCIWRYHRSQAIS